MSPTSWTSAGARAGEHLPVLGMPKPRMPSTPLKSGLPTPTQTHPHPHPNTHTHTNMSAAASMPALPAAREAVHVPRSRPSAPAACTAATCQAQPPSATHRGAPPCTAVSTLVQWCDGICAGSTLVQWCDGTCAGPPPSSHTPARGAHALALIRARPQARAHERARPREAGGLWRKQRARARGRTERPAHARPQHAMRARTTSHGRRYLSQWAMDTHTHTHTSAPVAVGDDRKGGGRVEVPHVRLPPRPCSVRQAMRVSELSLRHTRI